MWPEYLHHLTLHFAIVLPMVLAALGLWAHRTDSKPLILVIRWGGWIALAMTAVAVATGLLAGGFSGGDESLQHHRYLGILASLTVACACVLYDYGARRDLADLRASATGIWFVASYAVIGAAHWGTVAEHADVVPW